GRVGGDDLEDVDVQRQGQDDILAGHRLGNELDDRLGDLHLLQVDELKVVELGNGLHHLGLGRVVRLDQGLLELDAGAAGQSLGLVELVGAEGAVTEQDVNEVAARFSHGSRLRNVGRMRVEWSCRPAGWGRGDGRRAAAVVPTGNGRHRDLSTERSRRLDRSWMVSRYARDWPACKGKAPGFSRPTRAAGRLAWVLSFRRVLLPPPCRAITIYSPRHPPSRPNSHYPHSLRDRPWPRPKCPLGPTGQGGGSSEGQLLQAGAADLPTALSGLPPAGQAAGRVRDDRARRPVQGGRERE